MNDEMMAAAVRLLRVLHRWDAKHPLPSSVQAAAEALDYELACAGRRVWPKKEGGMR